MGFAMLLPNCRSKTEQYLAIKSNNMYASVPDKALPKAVIVDSKRYEVLGYLNVAKPQAEGRSTWKADSTKVVLKHGDNPEIVTDWPMKIYTALTKYEEVYAST